MRHPRLLLISCVVLLLASGCLGLGGPSSEDPSSQALVDTVNATSAAVDAYSFETEIELHATDGRSSRDVTLTIAGVVNRDARRMHATTEIDGTDVETFIDGRTVYTQCRGPGDGWGVENLTVDQWRTADPLGRQVALLFASSSYSVWNETLDGDAVTVIEASASADALSRFAERGNRLADLGSALQEATMLVRVDTTDSSVRETTLEFRIEDGDVTADATVTTMFDGYGDSVNITIPPSTQTDVRELGCPGV